MRLTIEEAQQRQRETTDVIHWRPTAERLAKGAVDLPGQRKAVPFEDLPTTDQHAEVVEFLQEASDATTVSNTDSSGARPVNA